jgi:two-component system, NarL family, nitrate/nitrite response regulator NarL
VFGIQQPFDDFGVGLKRRLVASPTIRILVVDDFEAWRQRIRSMLQTRPELCVVAEAADGLEAVQKAQELKPDLILLDIGLPGLNGIEVAHQVSRLVPSATIVFVSQNNDPDLVAAARTNGAKGYVLKVDVNRELLPVIDAVLRGDHFASTGLAQRRGTSPPSD